MAEQAKDSAWQYVFQSAVLENDREKRRKKVELAKTAIQNLLKDFPAEQSPRILKS